MSTKLKCPHCGRLMGKTVTEDTEATLRIIRPPTQKKKNVIDTVCPRCKNHMYMVISEQAAAN